MTALPGPAYHFRTAGQWERVSSAGLPESFVVDPKSGGEIERPGGCGIDRLAMRNDEVLLVDSRGLLFAGSAEGPRVGKARRLLAGPERLWVLTGRRLIQLDGATLHVLIDVPAEGVTDAAPDGRDGLWLLAGKDIRRMNERGLAVSVHERKDAPSQIAAAGGRLALLHRDGNRLDLLDPKTETAVSIDLDDLAQQQWPPAGDEEAPVWTGATVTLSSGDDVFLVEGAITPEPGRESRRFLLVSPAGDLLAGGRWRDDEAPALLIGDGKDLVGLFRADGGYRLLRFPGLAQPGGERRLTPVLETESPAGTWLRAEVTARLPERATLSLRWITSADEGLRRAVERIIEDPARTMTQRFAEVDTLLEGRPSGEFTYKGMRRDGQLLPERFAFPLHEAKEPLLWIDLKVRRAGADSAPEVYTLLVLHEAESLMDDLPAIYRGDGDRDGTMRRLVSVLEATSQGIDHRIGRVAERLVADRTGERWLPELAAMLGLPFHDALSADMQRKLVAAAGSILTRRGTRLGLLAMLEALFPDRPIRVFDRTEQLSPVMLGDGRAVPGGTLPALLAGPSMRIPRLNARLVLNRTGLCRTGACDDPLIAPPPEVLVSIPATGAERRRYRDAVAQMVEAMIPAGVRLRLRWTPWRRRRGALPEDVLTVVDAPEPLRMGDGQPLGGARVGGRRDARIDRGGITPTPHRLL